MYSNLVLAVPHAVGEVSIPALVEEATVKAWVARWTDWATDVLFGGKTEGGLTYHDGEGALFADSGRCGAVRG